jgi:hypothetical protein
MTGLRAAWATMVITVREVIGLRLMWWGLLALPDGPLQSSLAEALARAVAAEIARSGE